MCSLRLGLFGLYIGALLSAGCVHPTGLGDAPAPSLVLAEVLASNQATLADGDGDYPDWVELHNPTSEPVPLRGVGLSDDPEDPFAWVFSGGVLEPGATEVVFASGKDRADASQPFHTNFRLKSSGDQLVLTARNGQRLDRVQLPGLPPDVSMGRHPKSDAWQVYRRPTPGEINPEDGWSYPLEDASSGPSVQISEVLASNRTSLVDEDGDSSDWIELFNPRDTPVDLSFYALSDDLGEPYKWHLPGLVLAPFEYRVVFASGKNRVDPAGSLHTSFQLSKSEAVLLVDPLGEVVDRAQPPVSVSDRSYGRAGPDSDTWLYFPEPTPGGPNISQGFEDLSLAPFRVSETLRITEAQGNNASFRDEFGEASDWVEIQNVSDSAISLVGFGLTDTPEEPFRWMFPDKTLAPSEHVLVYLSGQDCAQAACKNHHAPFRLSNLGETLQITGVDRRVVDRFHTGRTGVGVSTGVLPEEPEVRVYFAKPTPGKLNEGSAYLGYVQRPKVSLAAAATEAAQQVRLDVQTPGAVVRYTLDGSEPSKRSALYTEAFSVSRSTTIRARAWQDSLLPSPIATRTVLWEAEHSLPIVALTVDPKEMFHPVKGLHSLGRDAEELFPYKGANFWKNDEIPAHLEIYETNGRLGLDMDLGLRIFGAYARAMPKKSFRLVASEEYGDSTIDYPLLVDKSYPEFDSFVLRTSGQDAVSARFRDVLMTQMIKESGVDYQGYRTVVLYLNGEYWGIYNIREKINSQMLARAHGVDPGDLSILRANGSSDQGDRTHYDELVSYARNHKLTEAEHYEKVQRMMDVENFAQYWMFQMFLSNADNGNIRFWREDTPGGRWRWILYDLDWGWRDIDSNTVNFATDPRGTGADQAFQTILLRRLLANDDFREMFLRYCGHHLQTTFEPSRALDLIDMLAKEIESEIPADRKRWRNTYKDWSQEIELMRQFAQERPDHFRSHIQRYFRLTDEQMVLYGIIEPN